LDFEPSAVWKRRVRRAMRMVLIFMVCGVVSYFYRGCADVGLLGLRGGE
jgi:hypothetical protein